MVGGSWGMATAMAREFQREYCIRQYVDEGRRDDMLKVTFQAPGTHISYDFFTYREGDRVSNNIQAMGSYESGLLEEMKRGMEKASEYLDVAPENLYFIDIGGNIGTHTLYLQSLGYHGLTFEPMPANEDLIRSNLCANDPYQLVTLFTKGLSDVAGICNVYTPLGNTGDGVVGCSNSAEETEGSDKAGMDTSKYILRGRLEVTTLDTFMYGGKTGVPSIQLPLGLMKMDVEGFELKVVLGGKKFFAAAKIPFIVLESWNLRKEDLEDLMSFFRSLGYKMSTEGFFTGLSEAPRHEGVIKDLFFSLI